MGRIAVYGFGRIGRLAVRAALSREMFVPGAVSDIKDPETLADLFSVDTNYGRWPERVAYGHGVFAIGERSIPYFNAGNGVPDWRGLDVTTVIDCTSLATRRVGAEQHISNGAERVLVSAPPKVASECDAVLLPGINMEDYRPDRHRIVSMASCTTNGLAPVVKVLQERFGIRDGFFSTVHAYTSTQSLTDTPMDARRDSWAAAENIIPSSSGAAKALGMIWPDLVMTGKSYRVPVRTGSIVELVANLNTSVHVEDVKNAFRDAAEHDPLKGIMGILEREYASSRVVGETHLSVVDLPLINVLNPSSPTPLASVCAWYDNEYGYANRLIETAVVLNGR